MNKINLEDIISDMIHYTSAGYDKEDIKLAMKYFGRKLLELAAKNAKIIDDPNSYCGNTGSEYPPDQIVSKQSILDTINQVE